MKCETCGQEGAYIKSVPWGKNECVKCRYKTGKCKICGQNRNDCCC